MGEAPTQDGHLAEELFVHLALPQRAPLMEDKSSIQQHCFSLRSFVGGEGSVSWAHHQDPPVALPVDAPQLDIRLGFDGGGPRRPVDQRQLPEAAALPDAGHPFVVDVHLEKNPQEALSHSRAMPRL